MALSGDTLDKTGNIREFAVIGCGAKTNNKAQFGTRIRPIYNHLKEYFLARFMPVNENNMCNADYGKLQREYNKILSATRALALLSVTNPPVLNVSFSFLL